VAINLHPAISRTVAWNKSRKLIPGRHGH